MTEWISEGEAGLRKWFGDHWKHAVNADVAAELDREAGLRVPAAAAAPEAPAVAPAVEATVEAGAAPAADASVTTTEGA